MHKAVSIVALLFISVPLAIAQPDPNHSPRFLVHLLDYLAKDYGGAVGEDHRVLSRPEYSEQREFAESAEKTESSLTETKGKPEIGKEVKELRAMIEAKASPEEVTRLARKIQAEVITVTGLEVFPNRWPDLSQGKALYAQNCAMCHGVNGGGDGLAARGLNPPPANFTNREFMKDLSPFNAFNTIRLGVPGTPMPPFHQLSDDEVWALAFYINSIRYVGANSSLARELVRNSETLKAVASLSDRGLLEKLPVARDKRQEAIASLRTYPGAEEQADTLAVARTKLLEAGDDYKNGNHSLAKTKAVQAYLEGIEPVEARIRASDPDAVIALEEKMAAVRSSIESSGSIAEVDAKIQVALAGIKAAQGLLAHVEVSPWISFVGSFSILLREGFEAVLIILALLGVIRAAGSKEAAHWVHGGWISALGLGFAAWFASRWLMQISGAGREMLEGVTSLFAVGMLLYVGFWLHRQTEVGRWKNFLEVKVKGFLHGKNLFGLAVISFVAVFREAIETVLFLQAIWLDAGSAARTALAAGVFSSLALVILLSWAALNYSKRLPIKQLFTFSSIMMLVLATILAGKGFHSLQEAGAIGVTSTPLHFRIDLIGVYPTIQTAVAQVITFGLVLAAWIYGKSPGALRENG